jgi:hypothetical protein
VRPKRKLNWQFSKDFLDRSYKKKRLQEVEFINSQQANRC